MMVDEIDCDDFYLDSFKKSKSKQQLSVRNPANLDKARSNILLKVRQLPITRQSAEILSKLVVNHKITDIVRVLKIGKTSVTIHAKVNVENRIFEKLKGDENVVIKVFYAAVNASNEIFAYSKNIHNEEKEQPTSQWPHTIETDKNYLYEKIILYQNQNIVIMKMFSKGKSIAQMISENPINNLEIYREILGLINDVKNRDYRLWLNDLCSVKSIIWWNEKWNLISTQILNDINNYDHKGSVRTISRIIIEINDQFHENGVKIPDLEYEFKNLYGNGNRWTFKGEVFDRVMTEYFWNEDANQKLPRKYLKMKYPKSKKVSKKSKK